MLRSIIRSSVSPILRSLVAGEGAGGGAAALLNYFEAEGATEPWFAATQPNSVYVSATDKTYISFESNVVDLRIARCVVFDHATQTFSTSAPMFRGISDDAHGAPSICLDHQGYMHAFGGGHNSAMQHAVEITAGSNLWEQRTAISLGTYPTGYSSASQLHVLYRGITEGTTKCGYYQKTTALSAGIPTWGSAVKIIDLDADSRFYRGNTVQIGTVVHMVFCRANDADTERKHVYYAKFDLATGDIDNFAETTTVTTAGYPLTLASANSNFRIIESGATDITIIPVLAMDSDGYPVIMYSKGATETALELMIVRWNGSAWSTPVQIGTLTDRIGNCCLVNTATGVDAYFSADTDALFARGGNIFRSTCLDGQTSWSAATEVASPDRSYPLDYPSAVLNGDSDIRVIWSERTDGDDAIEIGDLRGYAYGDGGLITRTPPTLWTPMALGDKLRCWWKAEDYISNRQWSDFKSLHQFTQTGSPVKSNTGFNDAYPGITFDNSAQYFTGSPTSTGLPRGSTQGELWAVAKAADTTPTGYYSLCVQGGSSGATRRQMLLNATGGIYQIGDGAVLHSVVSTTNPIIIRGRWETTLMSAWGNGTSYGSSAIGSLNTGTDLFLFGGTPGPSRYWKGPLSDFIATTLLTTDEAQKLEGWLAHNRGMTSYLPSDHPYKTTAPAA